jgi:ABC-type antimicrobial peptide transport system permease subunit
MGIRIALGARPAALRRMILRQTTVPVAAGIAAGLPLAAGATRLLGRFLFGVTPTDAASFAGAALLLALGGLAAADWPARRAARISPMEALRSE